MSAKTYYACMAGDYWYVCDAPSPDSENRICTVGRTDAAKADAVMIAARLNLHDDLVAALKDMLAAYEAINVGPAREPNSISCQEARRVLAKAEPSGPGDAGK